MGFLSSLVDGMGKAVADQFYPYYREACRQDSRTLCSYIENETNNTRKVICILALSTKDSYKTKEYYRQYQAICNNQFATLRKSPRFATDIDMFMRKIGSGY